MIEKVLIKKLIQYDSWQLLVLRGFSPENKCIEISKNEIEELCSIASLYAIDDLNDEKQNLAYEIITKLFLNFYKQYPNLYNIAYHILSRLGNFPNRELLSQYTHSSMRENLWLSLENRVRENENTIHITDDQQVCLTDFQKKFYTQITTNNFFSISAPTSSGKTFVFTLAIIRRLLENKKEKIVLVLPTKALIEELKQKIRSKLKEFKLEHDVIVQIAPIVQENQNKGIVYILTQERLHTLLTNEDFQDKYLDSCLVDEAQEIADTRGVVLQHTLELLILKYPNIKLFFASPLVKNPEYFGEVFSKNNDNSFIQNVSPVGQNIFLFNAKKGKPKQLNIEVINPYQNRQSIGTFELDFGYKNNPEQFYKQITLNNEITVIYCNSASDAEKKALKLLEHIDFLCSDDEVLELIDMLTEEVHAEYSLISCLRKGIVYHHGDMPNFVRTEIERLVCAKKITFVFCTSTLLQGVNIPAKNIVVCNPKSGNGNPMKRLKFLNLIGRAGRLKCEFHGNIWCIDTSNWENEECLLGENLLEVNSYYTNSILEKTTDIIEIVNQLSPKNSLNPVFGKFYFDHVLQQKDINIYKTSESYPFIQELYKKSQELSNTLEQKNLYKYLSIHPKNLDNLYIFLNKQEKIEEFIPAIKREVIKKIFQLINYYIFDKPNISEKGLNFHTQMAYAWIYEHTLSAIIENRLNHLKDKSKDKDQAKLANKTIREVIKFLEQDIEYKYAFAMRAYIEILDFILTQRGKDNIKILPFHLMLEYGTHQVETTNLVFLGLSRHTSIQLIRHTKELFENKEVNEYLTILERINIDSLGISPICKKELKRFVEGRI